MQAAPVSRLGTLHGEMVDAVLADGGLQRLAALAASEARGTVAIVEPSAGVAAEPERRVGARRGDARGPLAALGQSGATVSLTGLPSSGTSTIAAALEPKLVGAGTAAYLIDGDNVRHGLSRDLGFDVGSRAENRRARAGTLHGLTGVDDPYEPPPDPDLVLDGTRPIQDGVTALEAVLGERGLL